MGMVKVWTMTSLCSGLPNPWNSAKTLARHVSQPSAETLLGKLASLPVGEIQATVDGHPMICSRSNCPSFQLSNARDNGITNSLILMESYVAKLHDKRIHARVIPVALL